MKLIEVDNNPILRGVLPEILQLSLDVRRLSERWHRLHPVSSAP